MKFSNKFKIGWWVLLLILVGIILLYRLSDIVNGKPVPADLFIFLLFVVLMLIPIFSEMSFFGMSFKKDIDELKKEINLKLFEVKSEIRNSQTQNLYQTIQTLSPPPPDAKLPELESQIENIIKEKFGGSKIQEKHLASRIHVPENNLLLFKTRFNIEVEIRRIWEGRLDKDKVFSKKVLPIYRQIQDLVKFEIIPNNLYEILKEILAICNYGIHGEKVTDNQVSFVAKNAKEIIDYLKEIK